MILDFATLPPVSRYKLMTAAITPRPIAWVVTLGADGVRNCAPHSFFNMLGNDPALIVLGLMRSDKTGAEKDSAVNIRATRDLTVGLVREGDAAAMNLTAIDAPRGVDELALAGIETCPATQVAPPIIASAPASFECRVDQLLDYPGQTVVIARVLAMHVRDEFVVNADRLYLDSPAMELIARTHGSGWYARGTDQFQLDRPSYADRVTPST